MQIGKTIIEEILSRADDGVTRPFFCSCSDGHHYYVKGHDAGLETLWNETIAGLFAAEFDLPVPEFKFIEVPPELIKYSTFPDIQDLGERLAWGSHEVPCAISFSEYLTVPDDLKCRILMFDWLTRNDDRTAANPNLLWNSETQMLAVIDHNNAFAPDFQPAAFWEKHIFHDMGKEIFKKNSRPDYENRINRCIVKMDDCFALLPDEWTESESFDEYRNRVKTCISIPLERPELFWR